MNRIIFLTLFLVQCFNINSTNKLVRKEGEVLFWKAEKKAIDYRKALGRKNVYMDPIDLNMEIYKIFKKESPDLFENTSNYTDNLLMILIHENKNKDYYTDYDVIHILYNLCLNDYLILIDKVYSHFKNGEINFDVFSETIIQDFNLSNQLAKNYNNAEVISMFNKIVNDVNGKKIIIKKDSLLFRTKIERIISGKEWIEMLKSAEKIQPPILCPKCKH
jgi:hypothetical protein